MVRRLDDLCPDGVRIIVMWHDLEPGMSVFIPCINMEVCERQVAAVARRLQLRLKTKRTKCNNLLGLRIWRTT